MLKSMTAYGRAALHNKVGRFVVEIQSVNRKFLEIQIQLPSELSQFELEVKKWLLPRIARGQVTVKIFAFFEAFAPVVVRPNLAFARQLKLAWDAIAKETGVSEPFNLDLLTHSKELFYFDENQEDEELFREILKESVDQAFNAFIKVKMQEGRLLQEDICKRFEKIKECLRQIESKSAHATDKYREKLLSRLAELLPQHIENEERVLREVAIFAEKIDISEEITRFFCHLAHFDEIITSDETGVGKTLEFVIQEMNREINTIGSKSADSIIGRLVIEVKSELEKIREQIQNIE